MNIYTHIDMSTLSRKTNKKGLLERMWSSIRSKLEEQRIMRDVRISRREIAQGKARPIRDLINLD